MFRKKLLLSPTFQTSLSQTANKSKPAMDCTKDKTLLLMQPVFESMINDLQTKKQFIHLK